MLGDKDYVCSSEDCDDKRSECGGISDICGGGDGGVVGVSYGECDGVHCGISGCTV